MGSVFPMRRSLAVLICMLTPVTLSSVLFGAEILYVCNVPTNTSDTTIIDYVRSKGHNVTVVDDDVAQASDAAGKQLVMISESISPSKIGTKFRDIQVRVMLWDAHLQDDMGMTGPTVNTHYGWTDTDEKEIRIVDPSHPLAAGLSGNAVKIYRNDNNLGWGVPNANANIVAHHLDDDIANLEPCIYEYAAGAIMVNGLAAPATRIFFFMADAGVGNLDSDLHANGMNLLDAAIGFGITGGDATPPVISVPADIVVEASDANGAVITYILTVSDDKDPNPSVIYSHASGSLFPLGTTTVTIIATDNAGNSSNASFTVTVQDTTPPVIGGGDANGDGIADQALSAEATGPGGAIVNFNDVVSDAVDGDITINANPPSGSLFPLGTTLVGVTATDDAGNSSNLLLSITVVDTTPPTLSVPADVVVEAAQAGGAIVSYAAATAIDIVDTDITITYSQDSGTFFPIGVTTISVTATDDWGNSSSGNFTVTVQDTTPPTIGGDPRIVNGNMTIEATGPDGAVVDFVAAVDTADANPTVVATPASGSTFALGVTTVNVTATDAAGNTASGSFTVTVVDTTAPVVTVPADMIVEATSPAGASVGLPAPTVSDAVTPNPVVSLNPASGSTFALGATLVTITATDGAGNVGNASFTVTVLDTTPPTIGGDPRIVNGNMTIEATVPDGAVVDFVAAVDIADANPTVVATPSSGSTFALGVTTVNVTATDAAGNTASGSFTITVIDTTAPVVTAPADMTVEATSPAGASVVLPSPTVSDAVTPNPVVSLNPASGSTFALGATLVMITATDGAGNVGNASFTVTVQDTTPPTIGGDPRIVNGNMTIEATGPDGAVVDFVAAVDAADANPTVVATPASGSTFALGVTTVNVTATDAAGNTASGSFTVTVVDTTAPNLSVSDDVVVGASSPEGAVVNYDPALAADLVTADPVIAYSHASGSQFPLGLTVVTVTATDEAGNQSSETFNVLVAEISPTADAGPDRWANATIFQDAATTFAVSWQWSQVSGPEGGTIVFGSPDQEDTTLTADIEGLYMLRLTVTSSEGVVVFDEMNLVWDVTSPIILSVSGNVTVEATGPDGAVAEYVAADVSDNLSAVSLSYSQVSGTLFALGTTTVTVTATDAAGNSATTAFNVSVQDTTPPAIRGDITVEATGPEGATVNFAAATDVVDLNPLIDAEPASGSTFAIGSTTVNVVTTDASGNTASGSFNVIVTDTTAPVIGNLPGNVAIEADNPNGMVVTYPPASASDGASTPVLTYSHESGSVFPIGITVVTVTATDDAGNTSSGTFTVTVSADQTAPVIVTPPSVTTEASGGGGAMVDYPPATTEGPAAVSYSQPSGSFFPVGMTTVTVTATDASGNTSTATFNVIVTDTIAPGILSGPTANPNPAKIGETVVFSCAASDAQTIVWNWNFGDGVAASGALADVSHVYAAAGSYTVTMVATDAGGLSTTRSLEMLVEEPLGALAPPDFDGDGIPDHLDPDDDNDSWTDDEEFAAGTDPYNPNSFPARPLLITKLQGNAKFNGNGKDRYMVAGILPDMPRNFDPAGKQVTIDLGGATGAFKLDAKGRAKSANGTLRLKMKYKRNKATKKREFVGGPVTFQIRMKNGTWTPTWQDEGVDPDADRKKAPLPIGAELVLDQTHYSNNVETQYTAKAKRGGTFKFTMKRARK